MKHRTWNRFRAFLGGYFWLPCPLCGNNFGGHEWDGTSIPLSYGRGEGVCPDCREEAKNKTDAFYENIRNNYYMDQYGNLHSLRSNSPLKNLDSMRR